MDTEIEIKFLVSREINDSLPDLLPSCRILERDRQHLANTYFDTAELGLRRLGAGLRIRSQNGELEQTVKLAGSQVGGLHQRPEYNVALNVHNPDLSLFPATIWPEGADPLALQQGLQPLFCTDFVRRRWLVELNGTEVELALDEGEVQAGEHREPIRELELELVRGDASVLFELAEHLVRQGGLRLGAVSKAQRGYRLAGLSPMPELQALEPVALQPDESCEQAMVALLHQALAHWQHHEEGWLARPDIDWLVQLREGAALVHQILLMFGERVSLRVNCGWVDDLLWLQQQLSWLDRAQMLAHLTADKGHYLRRLDCRKNLLRLLAEQQQCLPDEQSLRELLHGPRYGRLVLGLTHWLYRQDWRAGLTREQQTQLLTPVASLAAPLLEDSWQTLRHSALGSEQLSVAQYIQQKGKLRRNLMVGLCFSRLFPEAERLGFRMPWLDILRGIEDLDMLSPLPELVDKLEPAEGAELAQWLDRKQGFLLEALEQSRRQALELMPYWR